MGIYKAHQITTDRGKRIADEATTYYWALDDDDRQLLLDITKHLYECQTLQNKRPRHRRCLGRGLESISGDEETGKS